MNKNAKIRSRFDKNGKFRTETVNRDEGSVTMAISTENRGATRLYVDNFMNNNTVVFSGTEARTLYRLLKMHYEQ